MERAGYHVVAFSEFKKPAVETHLAAFPDSVHLVNPTTGSTSITQIPKEVLEPYRDKVDIVFAGFPCQGFSHAGKKRQEDPRNELVYEFARVVEIVRPRWLIGENVPGLLSRKGRDPVTEETRPVIEIIEGIFQRIGYHLTYRVWKATDHGVPQERKRLILIGAPAEKGWPSASPASPALPTPLIPAASLAIRPLIESHLHGAIRFPKENLPTPLSPHYWISATEQEATGTPHPNLVRLVKGIRGLTKKEREESEEKGEKGEKEAIVPGGLISFGVRKSPYHGQILDPDLPAKTIICTYGVCPRLFVGLYHAETDTYWVRTLSTTELGRIQGFPADYPWKGKEKEIITQIGNAVPPPLATAVLQSLPHIVFHDKKQGQEEKEEKEQEEQEEQDDEE
jgi:DNA (cytosine-5)-methyltransferase 1